jgi:hypothetical protein
MFGKTTIAYPLQVLNDDDVPILKTKGIHINLRHRAVILRSSYLEGRLHVKVHAVVSYYLTLP